ncbi:MAG: transposase [Bifidobacteriaceae bacterium]|jgi:transposase|nr:transposase [Bifidobacteriaceae bacterium]
MSTQYSQEFKRDAVALVESGSTQEQVCCDLGVSKLVLSKWVNHPRLRVRGIELGDDPDERADQTTLLRRIEVLEIENEILRKASAYLSQANL